MAPSILSRQSDGTSGQNDNSSSLWWSGNAYAIKWGIIGAIFVFFLAFLIIGYVHAQARIRKGKPPHRYHRWLITRSQRLRFQPPTQNNPAYYGRNYGYAMNDYPPPPPAYNPDTDFVPAYSPPEGGAKVAANQDYATMPPPGPGPGHSAAEGSKAPEVHLTTPETSTSSIR